MTFASTSSGAGGWRRFPDTAWICRDILRGLGGASAGVESLLFARTTSIVDGSRGFPYTSQICHGVLWGSRGVGIGTGPGPRRRTAEGLRSTLTSFDDWARVVNTSPSIDGWRNSPDAGTVWHDIRRILWGCGRIGVGAEAGL